MIEGMNSLSTYLELPNSAKILFDRKVAMLNETVFDSQETTESYSHLLKSYRQITFSTPREWKEEPNTAEKLTYLWLNTIAANAAKQHISLKQAINRIDDSILEKKKKYTLKRVARHLLATALDEWKNKPQPAVKKAVSADRILKVYDEEGTTLDLSHQELDTFPDLFYFLPQLTKLKIEGNKLISMPDSLIYLTNLGLNTTAVKK